MRALSGDNPRDIKDIISWLGTNLFLNDRCTVFNGDENLTLCQYNIVQVKAV
jgi:hypothetical protein